MTENPKIRDIEIVPIMEGNQRKLLLRDNEQIVDKTLTLPYRSLLVVKFLDGVHDIRDIQAKILRETGELVYSEELEGFIELLDKHYFLDNDKFRNYKKRIEDDFKKQKIRKSILTDNSIPNDSDSLRRIIDGFFSFAESSEAIDGDVQNDDLKGIISPHIDFERGGICYSYVLKELATKCSKRKFLILGTGHNNLNSFFAFTKKSFETPFGIAKVDEVILNSLIEDLGESILQDEYCHRAEHSVEFQVLLLQYLFGDDPDLGQAIKILEKNVRKK